MYVYLDESGDLGFAKTGASHHFVITLLVTCNPYRVRRCIKRIRMRKLKKRLKDLPEIKANNSDRITRKRILRDLSKEDIEIHIVVLDKKTVYDYLREKKDILYNYICGLILTDISVHHHKHKRIHIVIDKRSKKRMIREDLDRYLKQKINQKAPEKYFFPPSIEISHLDSRTDAGLQAVDFVSWSIFRKYESNDDSYYQIIHEKITTEKKVFKKLNSD